MSLCSLHKHVNYLKEEYSKDWDKALKLAKKTGVVLCVITSDDDLRHDSTHDSKEESGNNSGESTESMSEP